MKKASKWVIGGLAVCFGLQALTSGLSGFHNVDDNSLRKDVPNGMEFTVDPGLSAKEARSKMPNMQNMKRSTWECLKASDGMLVKDNRDIPLVPLKQTKACEKSLEAGKPFKPTQVSVLKM